MWQSCQLKTRPDSNVCVQQYPACFLQKTPTEKKRQEQDAVHVTVLFHTAGWTVFLLLQAGALTPPRQIGWNNTEGFLWEVKSAHAHVHTHTHIAPFPQVGVKSGANKILHCLLSRGLLSLPSLKCLTLRPCDHEPLSVPSSGSLLPLPMHHTRLLVASSFKLQYVGFVYCFAESRCTSCQRRWSLALWFDGAVTCFLFNSSSSFHQAVLG